MMIYTFSDQLKERKWRKLERILESLHLFLTKNSFISLYCELFNPKVSLWGTTKRLLLLPSR